MSIDGTTLNLGPIGMPLTAVVLPSAMRQRCIQGLVPETRGFEGLSYPARKVSCVEEGMPPEQQNDSLWQQYFSDPTQWWDNRRSKQTQRHPDFRHKRSKVALWLDYLYKPASVDSQLAVWDSWMQRPSHSVYTPGEEQGALGKEAALDEDLEIGKCRKLCEDGRTTEAVDTLNLLVQRQFRVHNNLYFCLLKRCMTCKDLVLGRRVHALSIQGGYEGDSFLATHLIGLYASHGSLDEAMQVFTKVSTPDSYNWATIIFAYARHGEAAQAIQLYRQMRQSTVKPTSHIYVAVLKACAAAGDSVAGKEVHAHILTSPGKPNIFVQTSLVDMYAKCRNLEDARRVFDILPERNVVTWNALFSGYAQQGMGQEAFSLYSSMRQEGLCLPDSVTYVCLLQACASVGVEALNLGKQLHEEIEERGLQANVVVGNSLVNMYAKCGSLQNAHSMFDSLSNRNVITWTALIAGYAQKGMGQEALSLYTSMHHEGVTPPDSATFVCLLQACAIVADLPLGKQIHAEIEERGMQADPSVGAALVNMYAKCGSMIDSQKVFDSLPERTAESWGALTSGYTRQGDSEVVFDLVHRMRLESIQPDHITFLNLLTLCSHVGLVDKGRRYFVEMHRDYGISPTVEHYTCMLDLLGRAGHLDEALQMAKSMPCPPDGAVWQALLGACQKWNNVGIGQQVFEYAVSADRKDAASYVLMSNIYASAHMWDAAKEVHVRRVKCGAWKKPGQSWWTDMGGVVHPFGVGDKVHPEREIRLEQLVLKMEDGTTPSFVVTGRTK